MINPEARLAYELALGKRVSDNHWWRTRKLLQKHNLDLTVRNIHLLIDLRKQIPKSAVAVSGLLTAYEKAEQLTKKVKGTLKGIEIVNILANYEVTPHRTTISRWFKKAAGGYKRNREYIPEEVRSILIDGFIYKASNIGKLNQAG
jgi:hypothetical protein